ncbi:MAG: hypothetical protein DMF56_12745 [Acidobacteria bacterium]|nr:MAG: hypothetical protein DMF56_12745 [Acidobacteriota bacterium]
MSVCGGAKLTAYPATLPQTRWWSVISVPSTTFVEMIVSLQPPQLWVDAVDKTSTIETTKARSEIRHRRIASLSG